MAAGSVQSGSLVKRSQYNTLKPVLCLEGRNSVVLVWRCRKECDSRDFGGVKFDRVHKGSLVLALSLSSEMHCKNQGVEQEEIIAILDVLRTISQMNINVPWKIPG